MTNYQNGQKTKVVALHCSFLNLVELYSEVLLLWRLGALYTPPPIPTGLLDSYWILLGLQQISYWLITIQIWHPSES